MLSPHPLPEGEGDGERVLSVRLVIWIVEEILLSRLTRDLLDFLPLPEGEGWGEGSDFSS